MFEPELESEPEPEREREPEPEPDVLRTLELLRTESEVGRAAAEADATVTPRGRKRVVLIGGAPCSGKGTQCDRIVDGYGLVHISPGDLLRDHVRRDTELGRAAQPAMARGELVSPDIVIAVVLERMSRPDVLNRGCLLDNFPLTASRRRPWRAKSTRTSTCCCRRRATSSWPARRSAA